jgi:hypothetical protein
MIALTAALVLGMKSTPAKADCLIFILKDCPIANQYMPEIKRIEKEYSPKGIHFELLIEDSDATKAMLSKVRTDFELSTSMSIDSKHALAKRYGAAISPTAVVRSKDVVFYAGRIDNLYASIGKRRPAATTHDLRSALDAFLSGKPIKEKRTNAVGCRLF